MTRINWKHAFIGLLLGALIALFVSGELNGRVAESVQGVETGSDG
jgi:hypothetical protein